MSLTAGFAFILTQNLKEIDSNKPTPFVIKRFNLPKPLPMKLLSYIDHFLYQVDVEEIILPSAYVIIRPFLPYITSQNIHKVVFTALVIAYKAFTDRPVKNPTLEKIGVLKPGELRRLETDFLDFIDWSLKYRDLEEACKELIDNGKIEEQKIEDFFNAEENETNYSEQGSCDSFSELGFFF